MDKKAPAKEPEQKKDEKPKSSNEMHIKIYAPFKVYFDGQANSISGDNETGPFDILPQHHNFMTLLGSCELIVRTKEDEKKFKITRGIMHVKADEVVVFLDV
jgi:F0F1-type ATP synthase epsilon subunit